MSFTTYDAVHAVMMLVKAAKENSDSRKTAFSKRAEARAVGEMAEKGLRALQAAAKVAARAVDCGHALGEACWQNARSLTILTDEAVSTAEALMQDAKMIEEKNEGVYTALVLAYVAKLMEIRVASDAAGIRMGLAMRLYSKELYKAEEEEGGDAVAAAVSATLAAVATGEEQVATTTVAYADKAAAVAAAAAAAAVACDAVEVATAAVTASLNAANAAAAALSGEPPAKRRRSG